MHQSGRRASRAALLLIASIVAATLAPLPAGAAEYATWEDVEKARASEAATEALIERIEGQLDGLRTEVAAAQSLAERKGAEYAEADQLFQEAAERSSRLAEDLLTAEAAAEDAYRQAGQLAVYLTRAGGPDLTAAIAASGSADDFLKGMNSAGRLGGLAKAAYAAATESKNEVEALAAQAEEAEAEYSTRRASAERKLKEAQQATDAARQSLSASVARQAELDAQLAVLSERRTATEADFAAGVAARKAAEARARAEAEARARAEAEAAAGGSGGGQPSAGGWVNPTSGWISSPYGYRIHPVYKTYRLHTGTDVAGGCGTPIYAAAAGTVTYAGAYGSYGNWILIENGGGIQTGYAHIQDGGVLVSSGQRVTAGQLIARQGTTGASTGCHLHFEVRQGGVATDPVPFMRARGAGVGG